MRKRFAFWSQQTKRKFGAISELLQAFLLKRSFRADISNKLFGGSR